MIDLEKKLKKLYVDEGKSTYTIAEELGLTPSKVMYQLKKFNIPRRSKSEAQANALATGTVKHPTAGKHRTEADKLKISEGKSNYWNSLTDSEKEEQSKLLGQASKERWKNASEQEKEDNRKALAAGLRRSAKEGSKLEREILVKLRSSGYNVDYHAVGLVNDRSMEVDMWIPKLKIVIEIDGPAHFLPIWGEENLKKNQDAMNRKNGMVLGYGLVMLRIKNLDRHISEKRLRDVSNKVLEIVQQIERKFPEPSKRLIELET